MAKLYVCKAGVCGLLHDSTKESVLPRKFTINDDHAYTSCIRVGESIVLFDSSMPQYHFIVPSSTPIEEQDAVEPETGPTCKKCSGSGKFGNTQMPCYACMGKGWQTAEDVTTDADYDRRRKLGQLPSQQRRQTNGR